MAKFHQTAVMNDAEMEVKMTPLIDVIFQLLIFLMCAIHFRSLEVKLVARLPANDGIESPLKDIKARHVRIALTHNANNPLMPAIKLDDITVAGYDELTKTLGNIRNTTKEISVIIEPQKEIPTQCVIDAVNACKKAGVTPKLAK